jgi:hypothetical protein
MVTEPATDGKAFGVAVSSRAVRAVWLDLFRAQNRDLNSKLDFEPEEAAPAARFPKADVR